MTITRIASQATGVNGDNATSVTLAYPVNVSNGNLLLIGFMPYSPSADLPLAADCTKSAGTATVGTVAMDEGPRDMNFTGTEHLYTAIYSIPVTGTGSCTVTLGGRPAGSFMNLGIEEAHSDLGALTLENNTGTTGATGVADSGAINSAGAAIFFGCMSYLSIAPITITPAATFTQVFEEEDGQNHTTGSVIDRIVAASTNSSASWTAPNNNKWAASLAVYKEPGGGAAAPVAKQLIISQAAKRAAVY